MQMRLKRRIFIFKQIISYFVLPAHKGVNVVKNYLNMERPGSDANLFMSRT